MCKRSRTYSCDLASLSVQVNTMRMDICVSHGLEYLPDELIIRIFSWLTTADLMRIHSIPNKRMKSLSVDRALFRHITFGGCYHCEESQILQFLKTSSSVRTLSLADCYQLKMVTLLRTVPRLKQLSLLDLTNLHVSPKVLANILDNLPHLEALGLSAHGSIPLDSNYRAVSPFTDETIAALARLKHFKYSIGHVCIRNSLLPCVKNIESLVLDFMPFEQPYDHCSCAFFIRVPFFTEDVGNLKSVFAPRSVVHSHMFLNMVQTCLHSRFWQYMRTSNEVICFKSIHKVSKGASAGELEPWWTAFLRKDAGDDVKIESPFIQLSSREKWVPLEDKEMFDGTTSERDVVRKLKVCCLPGEYSKFSQKQIAILDRCQSYKLLEEIELVIGQGKQHFLSDVVERVHTDFFQEDGNVERDLFDDILGLVKQNQNLKKLSLMVSRQTAMSKKFVFDLSWCCSKLESFSLEFSKGFLNPQLTAHLNTLLPHMQSLCDLRIRSSYFQFNPQFVLSLQQCLHLRRLCILTQRGKCSACHKLPSLFNSCQRLVFVCLDSFNEHSACSNKKASEMSAIVRKRFGSSRPGIVITYSWRSLPNIPEVHFAEMVANRGSSR